MKYKTAISLLVVIVGIVGVMLWGRSVQTSSNPADNMPSSLSALTASENSFDFGQISMSKGLVEKTFTVTNPSDTDMTIERVFTSCMCTVAYISTTDGREKGPFGMPGHGVVPKANEIIKAGETRSVRVVFDPNAHGPAGVGMINRIVMIQDSAGGGLELMINAVVTP